MIVLLMKCISFIVTLETSVEMSTDLSTEQVNFDRRKNIPITYGTIQLNVYA